MGTTRLTCAVALACALFGTSPGQLHAQTRLPFNDDPDWVLEGAYNLNRLGRAVAAAGDVNGDGYGDVIIGEPSGLSGPSWGTVRVFLGSATGIRPNANFFLRMSDWELNGYSVSAGDFNSDGYSDVIFSAPMLDDVYPDQGSVRVHNGSPDGVERLPAKNWIGTQNGGRYGWAVAAVGDVNGDGYGDAAVGAPYENLGPGLSDAGRVWFYPGGMNGLTAGLNSRLRVQVGGIHFGTSVAAAGDVNGDGFADIIVGAPDYSNDEIGEGAAFLFTGSEVGPPKDPVWSFEPDIAGAACGTSVASAGDVNGDGYSDVVVGAPLVPGEFDPPDGRVYVFLGSSEGLSPSPDWTLTYGASVRFGTTVGTAGDVNGDGYGDLIVGFEHRYTDEPKELVNVYLGSPDGIVSVADQSIFQRSASSLFAATTTVASAGDVNGDGRSDVIVGNHADGYFAGMAAVYIARPPGVGTPQRPSFTIHGAQPHSRFASSAAAAGDVNGDGWTDVLVGAYHYDGQYEDEGAVFLYELTENGADPEPVWTASGHGAGEWFGHDIANLGDVNGDGRDDIAVGAPYYSGSEPNTGAVFVYLGTANGFGAEPDWIGTGSAESRYGFSIGGAGDVNLDGYADLVVGAFRHSGGQHEEGGVHVYLGSPHGFHESRSWFVESDQAGAWMGYSVSGAGDIDRDGFADIIAGAPMMDVLEPDEGAVIVYRGADSGLQGPVLRSIPRPGGRLGWRVSYAGDVDGDRFGDVIVGAKGPLNSIDGLATVFVYRGMKSRLGDEPVWEASGDPIGGAFGLALGTCGDIDGDGLSDLLVGDPGHDGGDPDIGRALAYLGSNATIPVTPAWEFVGDVGGGLAGASVSPLGDVDGDAFADFCIGAPGDGAGGASTGALHVFISAAGGRTRYAARQLQVDSAQPIGVQAFTEHARRFTLSVEFTPPTDANWVRIEWERSLLSAPAGGSGIRRTVWRRVDPADRRDGLMTIAENVFADDAPIGLQWRARVASDSPSQPYTRWMRQRYNPSALADLKVGFAPDIEPPPPPPPPPPEPEPTYGFDVRSIYPNPFNPSATLAFTLPREGFVEVTIFDVSGRKVRTLLAAIQPAGPHEVTWDGTGAGGERVASGLYIARLRFEGSRITRKMFLVK